MKHRKAKLIVFVGLALTVAMFSAANAELRFGPWVHFAPYYFPPAASGLGICFNPDDFAPKYEAPNPLRPPADGYCPPPVRRPARKVAQAIPRSQLSAPLADVGPRIRPHRITSPTSAAPTPSGQSAPRLRVRTGQATPSVGGQIQPSSQPQAVRTAPGNRPGAYPRRPSNSQL